jgi:hypothetical protein
MTTLNASDTRIPPAAFNAVAFKGARISIRRRDRETVYLVSERDIELLQAIEDALDASEAGEALERHAASGGKTIPLEDLKRRLGL